LLAFSNKLIAKSHDLLQKSPMIQPNAILLFNNVVGPSFLYPNALQKVTTHYQVMYLSHPNKLILNQCLLVQLSHHGKKLSIPMLNST
jgi:hypothetical protein